MIEPTACLIRKRKPQDAKRHDAICLPKGPFEGVVRLPPSAHVENPIELETFGGVHPCQADLSPFVSRHGSDRSPDVLPRPSDAVGDLKLIARTDTDIPGD